MRIFYVTPEFVDPVALQIRDGGLASYLSKIVLALKELGHSVGVICYADGNFDKCIWNGVPVYFVSRKFEKSFWNRICWGLYSRRRRRYLKLGLEQARMRTKKLLREINKRDKIDIVQYASWLATGKNAEKSIPYCIRISSYAKLWQQSYGYADSYEVNDERRQFETAKFLYGPSRYVANYIKNDLSLKTDISIIETPYLLSKIKEDESVLCDIRSRIGDSPYLLFFGTIGLLKGAYEIAGACKEILSRNPALNIILVGKEALIDGVSPVSLIRKAAGVFQTRVLHYQSLSHSKLIPVIRGAFAVMLPSRIDNLPNTCIESMGLGKIVIGSRGASFEQLIEDGVNGFLCDAGDAKSLAVAIGRLMALTEIDCEKMAKAASARCKKLHPSVIVPQVLSYYSKVIEEWSAR